MMDSTLVRLSRRTGNFLGFAACAGLMAYALFVQYGLGLTPCPLCILQRIAVIAAGAVFLVAALHDPGSAGARVYGALVAIAAAAGVAVAGRHIWVIAQPPGTVAECGAGLDYMLEIMPPGEVLMKVLRGSGECGRIDWSFLGLSMPAWVLISLLVVAAWGLYVNWSMPKPRAV